MISQYRADLPQNFVVNPSVPTNIVRSDDEKTRVQKSWNLPELEWLRNCGATYSIWWTDWDVFGAAPIVSVHDRAKAALFKLQFA